MISAYIRKYPLPGIQQGAALGNGFLGALLWGEKQTLNMTLGCSNLWDHQGGMAWTPAQNFKAIRKALEQNDEQEIRKLFAVKNVNGTNLRPSLIPLGRVCFTLREDCELSRYEILFETGEVKVFYDSPSGEKALTFSCDMECINGFSCEGLETSIQVELIGAGLLPGGKETLKNRFFEPVISGEKENKQAFLQKMPLDPSYGMMLKRSGTDFVLQFARGKKTLEELFSLSVPEAEVLRTKASQWWKDFWAKVPSVTIPDKDLDEVYTLGIYKYGIMTNPAGFTPGLQGPWIEDDMTPPWSGDYHFNINVQMCNTPGYKLGLFANIRPLFDLVLSWKESLRYNAKCFAGIEDGYMLPHAVDDRGVCMGGFWTGTIDHACAAWTAMMMFDYYRHTGDADFLRNEIFDFMKGVMRVFQAMMEHKEDGTLTLPVSISPEYGGSRMDAWGADSSFQLAAIHRLARDLICAAEVLQEKPDPFWLEVEEKLPLYTCIKTANGREIALWEGLALEESHRHHSHLGGITPFNTLDPRDESFAEVLKASLARWTGMGMGQWTGWCMSWASQIRTRLGHPDTAVYLLKTWKQYFTNPGGGSLHDAFYPGLTHFDGRGDIMQIDGAMGTVTAIGDLFVYEREGVLEFFRGIPQVWEESSFKGYCLPGGFTADGVFHSGRTEKIVVRSTRKALLRARTPDSSGIFELSMEKDQSVTLAVSDGKICQVTA